MNDLVLIPKEPNREVLQEYLKNGVLPIMGETREEIIKEFKKCYKAVIKAAASVNDAPILTHKQLQEIIANNPGNAMEIIQDILNKEVINTALISTRGNQTKTASILGINKGTLRARISKIRKNNPRYDLPI